jgi:alkanesulfonate monooxygenase SsuD/methylene tetrahydromethanopterin reductase-like flavin-dependent oxidoreductase (luciferase family)
VQAIAREAWVRLVLVDPETLAPAPGYVELTQFGIYAPTFGEYDVAALVQLARDAEAAGWDGFFIWDHLAWTPERGQDVADTTVALTAIAQSTQRLRFGALVTSLARRRPWKLAKEAATLDGISGGRLVVGAGLGAQGDLVPFGEGGSPAQLAARVDEGLDLLASLWSGEPVTHEGEHFRVQNAMLRPAPLQRPRIPIWIAGFWPNRAPFRRAARWDGALPLSAGHLLKPLSLAELRECRDYISAHRTGDDPFDLVAFAATGSRTGDVAQYEAAGATWWLEAVDPLRESLVEFRARIRRGPGS